MLAIFHLISSKRRLKESHKTIEMMGGAEECSSMVLAQHEMIGLEVNFYRTESKKDIIIFGLILLCGIGIALF